MQQVREDLKHDFPLHEQLDAETQRLSQCIGDAAQLARFAKDHAHELSKRGCVTAVFALAKMGHTGADHADTMQRIASNILCRGLTEFSLHEVCVLQASLAKMQNYSLHGDVKKLTVGHTARTLQSFLEADFARLACMLVHFEECETLPVWKLVRAEIERRGLNKFHLNDLAAIIGSLASSLAHASADSIKKLVPFIGGAAVKKDFSEYDSGASTTMAVVFALLRVTGFKKFLQWLEGEVTRIGLKTFGARDLLYLLWAFSCAREGEPFAISHLIVTDLDELGCVGFELRDLCVLAWTLALSGSLSTSRHRHICQRSFQLALLQGCDRELKQFFIDLGTCYESDDLCPERVRPHWVEYFQPFIDQIVAEELALMALALVGHDDRSTFSLKELVRGPHKDEHPGIHDVISNSSTMQHGKVMKRYFLQLGCPPSIASALRQVLEQNFDAVEVPRCAGHRTLQRIERAGQLRLTDCDLLVTYFYGTIRRLNEEWCLSLSRRQWVPLVDFIGGLQSVGAGKQVLFLDVEATHHGSLMDDSSFEQCLQKTLTPGKFVIASLGRQQGEARLFEALIQACQGLAALSMGPLRFMELLAGTITKRGAARPILLAGSHECFQLVCPKCNVKGNDNTIQSCLTTLGKSTEAPLRADAAFELGLAVSEVTPEDLVGEVLQAALRALKDSDADVRREAAFAVGRAASLAPRPQNEIARETLLGVVAHDKDALVKQQVCSVLPFWVHDDVLAGDVLVKQLQKESEESEQSTCCSVAVALGHVAARGQHNAVVALTALVTQDGKVSSDLRKAAIWALGRLVLPDERSNGAYEEAVPALLSHTLSEGGPRANESIEEAEQAVQALLNVFQGSSEPYFSSFFALLRSRELDLKRLEENSVECRRKRLGNHEARVPPADPGRTKRPRKDQNGSFMTVCASKNG